MPEEGNQKKPIRIAVVDDHQLFRDTLQLIYKEANLKIVLQAENGKDLIKQVDSFTNIDVVLLDINMPEMNGFDTMAWLHKVRPQFKVLIVTMHSGIEYALKMFALGAQGYITKNASREQLINAVEQVNAGHLYFSNDVAKALLETAAKQLKREELVVSVTDREREFLQFLSTDMTYKEISQKMFVSPRTVDGFKMQLCDKFGCSTRVGLVIYAVKNNIITIPNDTN